MKKLQDKNLSEQVRQKFLTQQVKTLSSIAFIVVVSTLLPIETPVFATANAAIVLSVDKFKINRFNVIRKWFLSGAGTVESVKALDEHEESILYLNTLNERSYIFQKNHSKSIAFLKFKNTPGKP